MQCLWPFLKMCYCIRHVCGHFGKCVILDNMFVAILDNVSFYTPCLWPFWKMCYSRCHVCGLFGKCVILYAMFVAILENVLF